MNRILTDPIKLGPRLHTIASFIPAGAFLGDIGTDHAYLPVYLLQTGVIAKAVGVDIHKGPYESALETVSTYGLKEKIEIRLGNGLAPLNKGEVDTLSIAGMGGTTILEILASNPQVIQEVNNLILQPQGAESQVRRQLLAHDWKLIDECLVEEDHRVYTIICLSRSEGLKGKDLEMRLDRSTFELKEFMESTLKSNSSKTLAIDLMKSIIWHLGPVIFEKKEKLLENILIDNIENRQKIIQEMNKTNREDVKLQTNRLKQEVLIMEGIRKWLSQ